MAITSAFKQFQRNFSPSRSLSDIGFGVGGMEGLPGRMTSPLSAAPLQRQAMGGGGGGSAMVPGATNIMMPLANLMPQTGQQQQVSPFAGTQFNFPVVQPAQTVGATYNITTGGDPFDWQAYIDSLNLGTETETTGTETTETETTGTETTAKGYTWDQSAFNRLFEAAGGEGLWGQGGLTRQQAYDRWFRAPRGEQYKKYVSDYLAEQAKPAAVTQPVGGGRGSVVEKSGERAAYAKAQSDAQKKVAEIKNRTSTQNLAARITRPPPKRVQPARPAAAPFIPYTPPKKVVAPPVARPTTVKQGGVGVGTFRTLPGGGWTGGF